MGKEVPVQMQPGLYTLETDRGAKNRWKTGDHVRWYNSLPQKIGGWTKTATATFVGLCRGILDWQSLAVEHLIALGTHLKLYVYSGGVFYDITPLRTSGTYANNPLTTTNGSAVVTIHHVAHGETAGDYIHISGAAAVATITVSGEYTITSVVDVDNFTITHSAPANANAVGGGAAVAYQYEIDIGNANSNAMLGYGALAYSASTYGTPRTSTNFLNMARIWSFDNWGEDLIACPRGGGIYVWDTSVSTGTRAAAIAGAPTNAKSILVSQEDRHLIALGAHDGSVADPLLIRWCTQEDYSSWTASASNTAGRKRLDGGTEILTGIKVGKEILVHTDSVFTSMVFEGPPYTFGFYNKGSNGGLRGPNAAKEFDGRGWWMGEGDFFVYDGRMRTLPCDVRNHVFDDLNVVQRAKVFAGANRKYGELWWLYCSSGSSECDRYVMVNVLASPMHWSFGTLARTVIVGDSKLFSPYGCGTNGYLYDHESGVNDDTSALASSLESWDMEVGDGEFMMHISKIIPDFKRLTGSMQLSLKSRRYPNSSEQLTTSVGSITSGTEFLNPHLRARQIALSLSTAAIGDDWSMGTLRIDVQPDGKQ